MRLALIYPPTCDPTAPYLSIPALTGFLRAKDIEVVPVDANIGAYTYLLQPTVLTRLAQKIETQFHALNKKKALSHEEQMQFLELWKTGTFLHRVPKEIQTALSVLQDRTGNRFFDPARYDAAVDVVTNALKLISAAYHPLSMDFTQYRTPFSFLTAEEIARDAQPERNPFHEYFIEQLGDLLRRESVSVIGISIVFPGQAQPAYSLAYCLKQLFPDTHFVCGGPFISQLLFRLPEQKIPRALGPFNTAVVGEGEECLLSLMQMLEMHKKSSPVLYQTTPINLETLPVPDFTDMPLKEYLSPEPILPYDPSRGCYWGKCAFCHYGPVKKGAAPYRQRPIETIIKHISLLSKRYQCSRFYFSHDALAPQLALQIARSIKESQLNITWATDMRPEKHLTSETCAELFAGGARAVSLGIESASQRVLTLMNKGIDINATTEVIRNLYSAGIATEAMCFLNFPTETVQEALDTLLFLKKNSGFLSLIMCGEFYLTHGSRVAMNPKEFGIEEIWHVEGDEFETGLFYESSAHERTDSEVTRIDALLDRISSRWLLRVYPWAGSLSTAHTILYYERYGIDAFCKLKEKPTRNQTTNCFRSNFDMHYMARLALNRETDIWNELVWERNAVSRIEYQRLTKGEEKFRALVKKQ